jgi:hypothetical protein
MVMANYNDFEKEEINIMIDCLVGLFVMITYMKLNKGEIILLCKNNYAPRRKLRGDNFFKEYSI